MINKKLKVGIISYGAGNILSCKQALTNMGFKVSIIYKPSDIYPLDIILLPGVGSFNLAMLSLKSNGMDEALINAGKNGTPIIGICLGMQLLANSSTENTYTKGLGLIPGLVNKTPLSNIHIGWNEIHVKSNIFKPLEKYNREIVYFNHEYSYQGSKEYIAAKTYLSQDRYVISCIKNKNLLGFQFHPEKSQSLGHEMLKDSIIYLTN